MSDADGTNHADRESDHPGGKVLPVVCTVSGAMASEVAAWLALHRAHEDGVTTLNGEYVTAGRPVAGFLIAAFDDLISSGLLALGWPTGRTRSDGSQCVSPTPASQICRAAPPRRPYRHGADDYR